LDAELLDFLSTPPSQPEQDALSQIAAAGGNTFSSTRTAGANGIGERPEVRMTATPAREEIIDQVFKSDARPINLMNIGPLSQESVLENTNRMDAGDFRLSPNLLTDIDPLSDARAQTSGPPEQVFENTDRIDAGDLQLNPSLLDPLSDAASRAQQAAQQAASLPDMVDAETDMEQRVLTDPNRDGYTNGLPDLLDTYTRPDGVSVTTNLGGLTEAQREGQPLSMDLAQMAGDRPYGYEIKDGNIVGSVGSGIGLLGPLTRGLQNLIGGPPQTTEDLLNRGVYTGLTDTSGPSEGGDSDQNGLLAQSIAQDVATVDPCPPGYELDPASNQCMPIDVVQPFEVARRSYGESVMPSLIGTPVGGFQQQQLRPSSPNMNFMRPAVNPFGFARGGIVELPKK
jgi:hypothetical protein